MLYVTFHCIRFTLALYFYDLLKCSEVLYTISSRIQLICAVALEQPHSSSKINDIVHNHEKETCPNRIGTQFERKSSYMCIHRYFIKLSPIFLGSNGVIMARQLKQELNLFNRHQHQVSNGHDGQGQPSRNEQSSQILGELDILVSCVVSSVRITRFCVDVVLQESHVKPFLSRTQICLQYP